MTFCVKAPAKVNWFLHINGQKQNGYHCLQTYYQFVDLCDELHFTPLSNPQIDLIDDSDIPFERNLVVQAARMIQVYAPDRGVRIALKKQIPIGGGLGGGSSDAAATLVALNHLWETHLPIETLQSMSTKLGADVPIFVSGQAALAEGIGEKLTPYEGTTPWLLIVAPNCQISTQKLFSHDELTRTTPRFRIEALKTQDRLKFDLPRFKNDFEPLVRKLYTSVADALDWLNTFSQARLSGTGCCVFAPFSSEEEAKNAYENMPGTMRGWVVKSLNDSPLFESKALIKKPEVAHI